MGTPAPELTKQELKPISIDGYRWAFSGIERCNDGKKAYLHTFTRRESDGQYSVIRCLPEDVSSGGLADLIRIGYSL